MAPAIKQWKYLIIKNILTVILTITEPIIIIHISIIIPHSFKIGNQIREIIVEEGKIGRTGGNVDWPGNYNRQKYVHGSDKKTKGYQKVNKLREK